MQGFHTEHIAIVVLNMENTVLHQNQNAMNHVPGIIIKLVAVTGPTLSIKQNQVNV